MAKLSFVDMTHRHQVLIGFVTGRARRTRQDPGRPRAHQAQTDHLPQGCDRSDIAADPDVEPVLGRRADKLAGTRSLDLIHPDDHERAVASWIDLMSSPDGAARQVRLRHLHRDGTIVWYEITNHDHLTDPDQPHVIAEMLDISNEMAAHEALNANEQLLRRRSPRTYLADALGLWPMPLGIRDAVDARRRTSSSLVPAARSAHRGRTDRLSNPQQ